MSRPDFSLELSASAQADFRDILSYTWQMWGDRQLDLYRDVIDASLQAIAKNPATGRKRADSHFLFTRAGRHLIFYRVEGKRILVVRILHAQMDIDSHLDAEP